jgi:uncharacterized delta-60 repeat protein
MTSLKSPRCVLFQSLQTFIGLTLLSVVHALAGPAPGSIDPSFDVGDGPDGPVLAIAVQGDGSVLAGGGFQFVSGQMSPGLVRLSTTGQLDPSFAANTDFDPQLQVNAVLLQADGKVVIGGQFQSWSGQSWNNIARLNADGSPDSSFNPGSGADDMVSALLQQPDGKLVVAGKFTHFGGQPRTLIARLNADGSFDNTFADSGALANSSFIFAQGALKLLRQTDGKILIGGDFLVNGSADGLARLDPDGTLDSTFKPPHGLNNSIRDMLLRPDGEILLAGDLTFDQNNRIRMGLLNTDGSVDSSFTGPGSDDLVFSIARQPSDGNLLIGGGFTQLNGTTRNRLGRLDPHGTLDTTFDPGTALTARANVLALQPDGTLFIGTDNASAGTTTHLVKMVAIPPPPVLALPDTTFNFVSSHPDNDRNWIFNVRQPSDNSGISVRIQASPTPSVEASWTDLPGGGQMTRLDSSTWQLTTDGIPTGANLYFRAIAAAPGFSDSISKTIQGPFSILIGLDISDPQPTPAISGRSWTFVANQPIQVDGTTVRVQTTLTPNVESSWTDLPGAQMSQLDPTAVSYWALTTTAVPAGQRYFRAISAIPGQPDSTSAALGPYSVVPDFYVFGEAPLSTTGAYRFEVHDAMAAGDASARVQFSSTPAVESSWTDLPGATALGQVTWGWSQVVNAVPPGEALYFRAIVARSGDPDIVSLPAGPLQVRMAFTVDDAGDSLLFIGPDPEPGQSLRVQSSATPNVEQSWTDVPGGQLPSTGAVTVGIANIPTGSQWFRIVASTPGQADGFSAALGPFQIAPQSFGVGAGSMAVLSPNVMATVNNAGILAPSSSTLAAGALARVVPGAGLVAAGGGNVVSHDGGTVISNDGGSVISNDGGSLVSNAGGTLIGDSGSSLIGDSGSTLLGDAGSEIRSTSFPAGNSSFALQSVSPSGASGSTGLRTIQGDFIQARSGVLAVAISGTNFSSTGVQAYDRIEATGQAQLSGLIGYSLLDPNDPVNNPKPFQPAAGDQFDILVASQVTATNLLVRGPLWGNGLVLMATVANLGDGRQALRLVATNAPPPLILEKYGAAYQLVYPTNYVGFTVQSSSNLTATGWTDLAGGTNRVLVSSPNGGRFYRLIKH